MSWLPGRMEVDTWVGQLPGTAERCYFQETKFSFLEGKQVQQPLSLQRRKMGFALPINLINLFWGGKGNTKDYLVDKDFY